MADYADSALIESDMGESAQTDDVQQKIGEYMQHGAKQDENQILTFENRILRKNLRTGKRPYSTTMEDRK